MLRQALYELVAVKQDKKVQQMSRVDAQSIGPDDSVSVASLSRLTPGKRTIPRLLAKHSQVKSISKHVSENPTISESGDIPEIPAISEHSSSEFQDEEDELDENVSDIKVVSLST